MVSSKGSPVPLGAHLELIRTDCPVTHAEIESMKDVPYDVAVGSVMYAMLCTRPDLAFAVSVLSRFMSNPGPKHWTGMKCTLRYLSCTSSLGLVYAGHSNNDLVGFVDSDFAGNKDTRKSTTGYFFT